MIYVPNTDYACYVIYNNGSTIRAYQELPDYDREIAYRDYYIHSNYTYNDSSEKFVSGLTLVPTCINKELLTDNYLYRVDFHKSLFIFVIFTFFAIYIPLKVVLRLFRRFNP